MSDTCKVFDNLHMQWMWIWMCPYNITAPLVDQALGSHLEIWVTPGQQMMVKCGDWGCRPNQDWSHITVCKVFDNLHMQWMCIWMCPNNIPAAPADQALGCLKKYANVYLRTFDWMEGVSYLSELGFWRHVPRTDVPQNITTSTTLRMCNSCPLDFSASFRSPNCY